MNTFRFDPKIKEHALIMKEANQFMNNICDGQHKTLQEIGEMTTEVLHFIERRCEESNVPFKFSSAQTLDVMMVVMRTNACKGGIDE